MTIFITNDPAVHRVLPTKLHESGDLRKCRHTKASGSVQTQLPTESAVPLLESGSPWYFNAVQKLTLRTNGVVNSVVNRFAEGASAVLR